MLLLLSFACVSEGVLWTLTCTVTILLSNSLCTSWSLANRQAGLWPW